MQGGIQKEPLTCALLLLSPTKPTCAIEQIKAKVSNGEETIATLARKTVET